MYQTLVFAVPVVSAALYLGTAAEKLALTFLT